MAVELEVQEAVVLRLVVAEELEPVLLLRIINVQ